MRFVLIALFFTACSTKTKTPERPPIVVGPGAPAPSLPAHGAVSVGAPIPAGEPQSLAKILASPDEYAGKTVLVEGRVRAACQRKGCWMEIAPIKEGTPACRVRFKDYGFFVPTDSTGAEARLSGEVSVRTLPPEEVAHLEGEGATLKKSADGSAKAVEITATGVELMRL